MPEDNTDGPRCHICGYEHFSYSRLYAEKISVTSESASWLERAFSGDCDLPVRVCERCKNLQIFLYNNAYWKK